MKLDETVAQRISMLRFLLIATVVFLHIADPPSIATLDMDNALEVLRAFTQEQLGRICVPALTMISAYLLFSGNLDLAPGKLYRKKAKTLLIPFAVFNIGYVALLAAVEYTTGYVPFTPIAEAGRMEVANMLFSLTASPMNNALHFLRELFVLILLAPVFGFFLRRMPWVGLALVAGLFLFNLERHLVLRDTMAVMFYIGGMAAVGKWDVLRLDRYAVHCAAALLLLCAALIALRVEDRTLIYITAPLLVWPMAALVQGTAFGDWAARRSEYSFFIFLCHIPLIEILRRVYLHVDHVVPEALFVYGAPVVLIAFLIGAYKVLNHVMPQAFALMVGGRARRPRGAVLAPNGLAAQ